MAGRDTRGRDIGRRAKLKAPSRSPAIGTMCAGAAGRLSASETRGGVAALPGRSRISPAVNPGCACFCRSPWSASGGGN